jgi:hypothetical protein
MKKFITELYLKFNRLPLWVGFPIFIIGLFCLIGFWTLIIEPRIKWVLEPALSIFLYIFESTIYLGGGLFSAGWFVYLTISTIKKTEFGEIKMKELPKLFGIIFLCFFWVFFTFLLIGAGINTILLPFDISLQSMGILPHNNPTYFLDNPVYFFGYKIIPIFD